MNAPLPSRIRAENLLIGRWITADTQAMTDLIDDSLEHLRPWMAWAADEPLSPSRRIEQFKRWDQYWASGDGAVYSIRFGGRLVGGCALHRRPDNSGLEIGYWLGRHATGKGIATSTVTALLDAAATLPAITYVQISHDPTNISSAGIPLRLGFTQVAATPGVDATVWRTILAQ